MRHAFATSTIALLAALAGADTLRFDPPAPLVDGHYGAAVALCHDIDFDGYADLLVGAPQYAASGVAGAGAIHLYSGKSGALLRTQSSPDPTVDGAFGAAVLGLPDLNGDGRSEYAVGSPGEDGGKGRVRVYSGANGTLLWFGSGFVGMSGFGGCLAVVPDCSGDGKVELAVGNGGPSKGQSWVRIYQAANGLSWKILTRPSGDTADPAYGHAIGGIPDVTGDGRGDVIVGAPRWNQGSLADAGAAWIYDGANGTLVRAIESVDATALGQFGAAVAGIGDLDGDGRGEVLVGAPGEAMEGAGNGSGRAYVFSGATGGLRNALTPSSTWEGDHFGAALCVAANLDDDGSPDIVVAAPEAGGSEVGYVYRFSGASGQMIGLSLISYFSTRSTGASLSAIADCTQDGRSDIAAGAPTSASNGASAAGAAVLWRLVANDGCGPTNQPIEVGVGGTYFSNVGATNFQTVEGACGVADPATLASDVHFTFHAPRAGVAIISTCSTTFDTWIALYRGCDFTEFGCVWGPADACNDDWPGCGNGGSQASVPLAAGECLRIRVGGVGLGQGIATLLVEFGLGCGGDLDGSGGVDAADLAILLGQWGTPGPADLDGNGQADAADLAILLGAWGPC